MTRPKLPTETYTLIRGHWTSDNDSGVELVLLPFGWFAIYENTEYTSAELSSMDHWIELARPITATQPDQGLSGTALKQYTEDIEWQLANAIFERADRLSSFELIETDWVATLRKQFGAEL